MNPPAFLREDAVRLIVQQVAKCAAVPVALHLVENALERALITASGQCAACRYVAGLRSGNAACLASRAKAIKAATSNQFITPFICHVGFACTVAPIDLDGVSAVLTFGPYCPAEAPDGLDSDFMERVAALGSGKGARGLGPEVRAPWAGSQAAGTSQLPVSLNDVRVVPVAAIPAIAEWTVEKIGDLWRREAEINAFPGSSSLPGTSQEEEDDGPGKHRSKSQSRFVSADPYQANAIAAALAGGKKSQAQALIRASLAERKSKQSGIDWKRARIVALCAAVLEAAERAGIETGARFGQLPDLIGQVQAAQSDADLLTAALRFLTMREKRKEEKKENGERKEGDYEELNQILLDNLLEGITLGEAAEKLGMTPSAITHRLQRKFDMSFSEYVGRLRVDRAKELLRRTRLSIAQVAVRVGIADPSNLGKLFRKFENMSPLEYRERFADPRRSRS